MGDPPVLVGSLTAPSLTAPEYQHILVGDRCYKYDEKLEAMVDVDNGELMPQCVPPTLDSIAQELAETNKQLKAINEKQDTILALLGVDVPSGP